jgi:hypothetical protein
MMFSLGHGSKGDILKICRRINQKVEGFKINTLGHKLMHNITGWYLDIIRIDESRVEQNILKLNLKEYPGRRPKSR